MTGTRIPPEKRQSSAEPAWDLGGDEAAHPARLRWPTKITYALSGIPPMIEQRGISAFLLIFYSQVVGLPAHVVASVLLIVSVFDSLCDPFIGQVSDNFHSRLGRRHPFIYASIIPVTVSFAMLWSPPEGWSHLALTIWLLGTLLVLRFADTLFDLPSSALLPELTRDYDVRTTIVSLRTAFALLAGTGMTMLAYQVFLPEKANGTGGVLARDGYSEYGLTAAALIAFAILVSGLGTHRRIPYLSKPPRRPAGLRPMMREIAQTVSNRSFVALLAVGMMMSIANGARLTLELYFGLYFWNLTQTQLSVLLAITLMGTIPGALLAPVLARRFGKREIASCVILGGIIGNVGPVLGRLAGIMPENGTNGLFAILAADIGFTYCVATITTVMLTSMLNDVVEEVEVQTGRRSEGLLLAADSFLKKLVAGVGVFVSGVMLTFIAFPQHAERDAVAPEIVARLAYGYVPITALYFGALCVLRLYRIDRRRHQANLETLKERP
ncbi:MFS transporter [Sphingobium sp. EM0848]|uniref:MFS transporter n=1 Tax=Sphingobium sp. EM0848 TaxID=2743473 RepID=UPI00159C4462|nr:MFS transporter [Sphingobium sp. EM0848]